MHEARCQRVGWKKITRGGGRGEEEGPAAVLEGGGGDRERAVPTQVTQPGLQEAAGQG